MHTAIIYQRKMAKATTMHTKNMLGKYLAAWCKYMEYRKESEQQKLDALERRRQMLIRRGLTRWFQTTVTKGKLPSPIDAFSPPISYNDPYHFNPPERPAPRKPFETIANDIRTRIGEAVPPLVLQPPVIQTQPTVAPQAARTQQVVSEILRIETVLHDFNEVRQSVMQSKLEMSQLYQQLQQHLLPSEIDNANLLQFESHDIAIAHSKYTMLKQRIAKFAAFKKTHLPEILLTLNKLKSEMDL